MDTRPRFTTNTTTNVKSSGKEQDGQIIRTLLKKVKDEESMRTQQKAKFQMMLQKKEKQLKQVEKELMLAQEHTAYRVQEINHLKQALKQRDDELERMMFKKKEDIERLMEMALL